MVFAAAKISLSLILGLPLIAVSFYLFGRLFADPIRQEIRYGAITPAYTPALTPPNTDFAIVIEKIGASSAVIQGVDPYDSQQYQVALKNGVAQALGTSLPGEGGNIFIFAHSSADLLTAERYNSVFYLMHHLENGDVIKVWKDGEEYDYGVTDKKYVDATDTHYLTDKIWTEQLTLMTCWPPGTTYKRLIIFAKPIVDLL